MELGLIDAGCYYNYLEFYASETNNGKESVIITPELTHGSFYDVIKDSVNPIKFKNELRKVMFYLYKVLNDPNIMPTCRQYKDGHACKPINYSNETRYESYFQLIHLKDLSKVDTSIPFKNYLRHFVLIYQFLHYF